MFTLRTTVLNKRALMPSLNDMLSYNSERRTQAFSDIVKQAQQIWILNDNDGAVMLVTEDEDCIPVWPSEEAALLWRTAEWEHCEAIAISLEVWLARWTKGMQEDEVSVVVFPVPGEDGLVVFPDEFEAMLQPKSV